MQGEGCIKIGLMIGVLLIAAVGAGMLLVWIGESRTSMGAVSVPDNVPPENRDVAPVIYGLCGSPLVLVLGLLGAVRYQAQITGSALVVFGVMALVVLVIIAVAYAFLKGGPFGTIIE